MWVQLTAKIGYMSGFMVNHHVCLGFQRALQFPYTFIKVNLRTKIQANMNNVQYFNKYCDAFNLNVAK